MKKLIILLFLLGGCAQWVPLERDVIVRIRDYPTIQEKYIEYGGRVPRGKEGKVRGFTLIGRPTCEIWLMPRGFWDGTFLHELKHCDFGDYHRY